jgi:outer membrane protein TolC
LTNNPQLATDEQALSQRAVENRKELVALRHQKESLKAVTRAQRAGLAPSLNLSVQYSKNWETGGFGSSDSSTVGVLSLALPIYDSGITRARVDAARKDEQSLDVRLKQTELLISLEVRQAITNWKNAQARLGVAESQEKSAQETFRLAQHRFTEGEGINLEVIDAQNQLTAAKVARLAALYDSQIAFAELQKAVGVDELAAPAGGNE